MDDQYINRIMTTAILIILGVLVFFLVKPILMSIVLGIILAYIFSPIYNFTLKTTKSPNISASLISTVLVLLIVLTLWFLVPVLISQSIRIYVAAQQTDLITPLKIIFPKIFSSESFTNQVSTTLHSFIAKTANDLVNSLTSVILNFPSFALQLTVVFFTFFFVLRDKEEMVDYIKSLLPFSKDIEKRLFEYSSGITSSVIYGQIILGILGGVIIGIGYFIFRVPNPLFLTFLTTIVGVLPIIGTSVIWIPVVIFLIIGGSNIAAGGIVFFGIVSWIAEHVLRPAIVSQKTSMNSWVILISMVGGLFMFGVMGLILGPLIISYLLIILEIYRKKKVSGVFIEGPVINPK
ncbi:MAG: AI-2E family transporter [Nanoarchaeota archaeon]